MFKKMVSITLIIWLLLGGIPLEANNKQILRIEPGETYEIICKDDEKLNFVYDGEYEAMKYAYSTDEYIATGKNYGYKPLIQGDRYIVSVKSGFIEFSADWSKLMVNKLNRPALLSKKLVAGESYTVTNYSGKAKTSKVNIQAQTEITNVSRTIKKVNGQSSNHDSEYKMGVSWFPLYSGESAIITVKSGEVVVFVNYEDFAPNYKSGTDVLVNNYLVSTEFSSVSSNNNDGAKDEINEYLYNETDVGNLLNLPYADLQQIKDPITAAEIVTKASRLLTSEQKQSPTAVDKITHYAEAAISYAAAKEIDSHDIMVDSNLVADLQVIAKESKTAVEQVLKNNGIVTNRIINTDVKLVVPKTDKLTLTIDKKITGIAIDNIKVEGSDLEVAINTKKIKTDITDSLPLIITIEEVGDMTRLGVNNSDKELLVSAVNSKTVKVSFNKGRVNENIKISLPPVGAKTTYQVVINENGEAVTSKYNPTTDKIEAKINTGGVYTVKENYKDFSDIQNKTQEMQDAIRYLASKGIISGTRPTTFNPDGSISRAEIAALIVRALGKMDANADGGFKDVNRNNWYYGTAGSSKRYGIITGYEDNTFRGTLVIPKDQIVAVAARTLKQEMKYKEPENKAMYLKYTDNSNIAEWAANDIALATRENLVVKRTDGKFQPESSMTRGDAAIILKRMFDRIW